MLERSMTATLDTPGDPFSIRVVTWNIHKGVGGADRLYDMGRVARCLKRYAADVVLLQEVAQSMRRLKMEDQAAYLTQDLAMHAAYRREHGFRSGGHYGNLILSRFPVSEEHHLDLTIGRRKQRGCLQVKLQMPSGVGPPSLVANNLHLGLVGTERDAQLTRFTRWQGLKQHGAKVPLLVGGDLNDVWATLGRKHLKGADLRRAGAVRNSFPATVPLRPLDGLYYRGSLTLVHAYVARCDLARAASDHRPVVADFRFSP